MSHNYFLFLTVKFIVKSKSNNPVKNFLILISHQMLFKCYNTSKYNKTTRNIISS